MLAPPTLPGSDATLPGGDEAALVSVGQIQAKNPAAPAPLPQPLAEAADAAEPSWGEVMKLVWNRLKRSFAKHRAKAKTYVGTLLAVGVVGLIPWPYQISCDVVCEPVLRRYIAAPFDAILLQSNVKAGEQVQAGQVLASLDGGELRTELASLRARLAQSDQRQLAALASGDHSSAESERLEVEQLQREIELYETRQEKLDIRSPIDGVIVTGDLERVAGAPLSVGQSLYEIACLDRLIAEVAVPEDVVAGVRRDMPVRVVLDAAPGMAQKSQILNVHLRNEIRDNASVFIAEAELSNPDQLLRPGMSGTANIHAGYRPLGWVLFHRPYYALRSWLGV